MGSVWQILDNKIAWSNLKFTKIILSGKELKEENIENMLKGEQLESDCNISWKQSDCFNLSSVSRKKEK